MLDKAVGHVGDADLLVSEGVNQQVGHSFVAFGFDGSGAVSEGLLHEGDDVGLGLEIRALRIFFLGHRLAHGGIGEKIIGVGGVQKLLGKGALGGRGLVVVFVLGEVFGHGDELAADVVPGIEHDLGFGVGGLYGGFFFCVLGVGGNGSDGDGK